MTPLTPEFMLAFTVNVLKAVAILAVPLVLAAAVLAVLL